MAKNRLYHHLRETFEKDCIDVWSIDDLIDLYDKKSLDAVINEEFLVIMSGKSHVRIAFRQVGTVANLISNKASKGVFEFHELLSKMPKSQKVSSSDMKDFLSFLIDFGQLQEFTLPGCAFTYVTKDSDDEVTWEKSKLMYYWSSNMETRSIHQMSTDDGLEELREAVREDEKDGQAA